MSDAESKGPPNAEPAPKGVGSGEGREGSQTGPKSLARTMQQTATHLRSEFASQVAQDPKRFKKRAVYYLKRYLPPGPGRPAGGAVTKAIELRKKGLEWKEIYPQCIPRHAQLSPAVRRQAEYDLRGVCRSRRNAARRRKRQRSFSAATKPPANVPSRSQPDFTLKLEG